ncbi:VOC family protein (plasmid) [Pedobacter sp. BS3]|uniref:VOC family protein n=1 Tax=Pedobacter sp. BS3 TaxID=2567937 RepID=UPI0011ED612C|nr:VOC family protein [Pedobacter sp. BS3]TZF85582.1 VOC family protein [Pedobacter sp. BS3]
MQKLRKIDAQTNVINWFEIAVLDSDRARTFYETILDIKMHTIFVEETDEELTFFPSDPAVIQATSGRVTGCLTKNNRVKPSQNGTLIYLNASPNIQTVIDRIEPAGGKVITSKTLIKAGYICVFTDTEGNRVALHAEA